MYIYCVYLGQLNSHADCRAASSMPTLHEPEDLKNEENSRVSGGEGIEEGVGDGEWNGKVYVRRRVNFQSVWITPPIHTPLSLLTNWTTAPPFSRWILVVSNAQGLKGAAGGREQQEQPQQIGIFGRDAAEKDQANVESKVKEIRAKVFAYR